MTRLSVATLARDADRIVSRVADKGERIVLRKGNKNMAVLMPFRDAALLDRIVAEVEDRLDNDAADRARHEPSYPWKQVKKEAGL